LFVAVDVPDDVRQRLADAAAGWRDAVPGARWVPPGNWHVTLKFLGSVWPRLHDWVVAEVGGAAAEVEPFETRLAEVGAFPSSRKARVLWAGLDDVSGGFQALASALDRRLEREFPSEKRPYTAHLTVARLKQQVAIPPEVLAASVGSEQFPVDRLVLYRSYLQRPAARYEPLGRFPMGS